MGIVALDSLQQTHSSQPGRQMAWARRTWVYWRCLAVDVRLYTGWVSIFPHHEIEYHLNKCADGACSAFQCFADTWDGGAWSSPCYTRTRC